MKRKVLLAANAFKKPPADSTDAAEEEGELLVGYREVLLVVAWDCKVNIGQLVRTRDKEWKKLIKSLDGGAKRCAQKAWKWLSVPANEPHKLVFPVEVRLTVREFTDLRLCRHAAANVLLAQSAADLPEIFAAAPEPPLPPEVRPAGRGDRSPPTLSR